MMPKPGKKNAKITVTALKLTASIFEDIRKSNPKTWKLRNYSSIRF